MASGISEGRGQRGQFALGCKNNGMIKNFINQNFTYIDLKKVLTHVVTLVFGLEFPFNI
jgi:hypothetical protein